MRILIADKFLPVGVDALKAAGMEVTSMPDAGADGMADAIKQVDPDVLVVRGTKVKRAALEAGQRLSLVVRAGAGVDNIDMDAASELAIFVANCPGANSAAVAELAFGLLLCCDRRIPDATIALRAGKWEKGNYSKARGLLGRKLGVIGLGSIGMQVVGRAESFGMPVIAWSRSLTPKRAASIGVEFAATPLEVAAASDAVTLHIAADATTKHFIGEAFFHAMRPGAYFINTTRGSVVDPVALKKAIETKKIRAGLDVFDQEPAGNEAPFADPIVQVPGVYGAPHIGASTDQAQEAIAEETVRIIRAYLATGSVHNCVNKSVEPRGKALLVVRHRNKPGVLAAVFEVIGKERINVEDMENVIYAGGASATARIRLAQPLSESSQSALKKCHADILSVTSGTA